jgi:hypothetical protein
MPRDTYSGDATRSLGMRLKHAWNVFRNKDPIYTDVNDPKRNEYAYYPGYLSTVRPDRVRLSPSVDKTIITAIYNRIALDVCQANLRHVRTDQNGMFKEEMKSGLNNILTCEANIDQTARAFIFDFMLSMMDEGVVAGVPVDTSVDPNDATSFEILSMRVGKIVNWEPYHVQLEVYNERTGRKEHVRMAKRSVAIVENPFYAVMNEPNSTLRRLAHKMALMDVIDDQIGSKKLDVIIQLPYVVKNKTKQEQAEERRRQLEEQLENSKLGVGYIDGTERIVQLNRSLENNLMKQVESLTSMLYSQLGITPEIMDGTASEEVMTNYYKRTINVYLQAITEEFERKFLTKTARTQHQAVQFYREPFSLTPTSLIADIADKFTRNEILSPNEIRGVVGFMPSSDEAANELRNRNINQANGEQQLPFAKADEGGDADGAAAGAENQGNPGQPGEMNGDKIPIDVALGL